MAIILETGINEQEKILDLFQDINIAKENKMKSIEKNKQYQHNGGGTAILLKETLIIKIPERFLTMINALHR